MPPYEVVAFPVSRHEQEGDPLLPRTANELAASMNEYLNAVERTGGRLIAQTVVEVRPNPNPREEAYEYMSKKQAKEAQAEEQTPTPHVFLTTYTPDKPTTDIE